jgi:hypothetical protein
MSLPPAKSAEHYQPEKPVVCIRSTDGMLVMANSMAQQHSMGVLRPYHGPLNATHEQRLLYLRGYNPETGGTVKEAIEAGKFDIDSASRGDLIEYASDEFGADLGGIKTRREVYEAVLKLREKNAAPPAAGISATH